MTAQGWACPAPLRHYYRITMAHGGGGQLTDDLVRHLFLPMFGPAAAVTPTDAAVLDLAPDPGGGRLAFTTDGSVVRPLFFPGGDIGTLAVNGTVNDLAMMGAMPRALSVAFVLEEGVELEVVARVAASMGAAAATAGVALVTGDTKVVEAATPEPGLSIVTSGIGTIADGLDLRPERATPGDAVIVSGPVGRHGIAVLSVREGFDFATTLESDCAPLHDLVATMLATRADVHVLRDPTRGGLAATLCELAETAGVGIVFDEAAVMVPPEVDAACSFLGLDPLHVANEGVLVAMVAPDDADRLVAAMRDHPLGAGAAVVGEVTAPDPARVSARTALGVHRLVTRPAGEQLPRIC